MKRVFLVVLDSFGIGAEPDADLFGDVGTNTLGSCATSPYFRFENMRKLGEKFDQDAIMIYPFDEKTHTKSKPYLIGTSKRKEAYPGYGKIVQLNKVEYGKEAQAMTKVNGRPYHASVSYFNY